MIQSIAQWLCYPVNPCSYMNPEGNINHASFLMGEEDANGGIGAFLCANLGNGPEGTPACPGPRAGTVSGTITGAQIIGPAGQGLAPGEIAELLHAIDRKVTYANVHTSKYMGREIRGPIDHQD